MTIELKKVFLDEGDVVVRDYQLDMSSVDFNGAKPFISPVTVNASVKNKAGIIQFSADVKFDFCYPCDRCTVNVNQAYSYSFGHVLVLPSKENSEDDYIEVKDYKLDLDELIISDILLELPHKILCKQDCKGLCPKCGKNLNEGACECVAYQIDPRLEVLKKLID